MTPHTDSNALTGLCLRFVHARPRALARTFGLSLCAVLLIACGTSKTLSPAPVEDRGTAIGKVAPPASPVPVASGSIATAPVASANSGSPVVSSSAPVVTPAPLEAKPPLPGAENAGKPGYYMVKPGDTLIRIGLENGQSWRDLIRWNSLDNPNRIEVGQVLRVIPPGVTLPAGTVTGESGVVTRPVTNAAATAGMPLPAALPVTAPGVVGAAAGGVTSAPSVSKASAPAVSSDEDISWMWPASGIVMAGFDEAKNKGLDLAGKAGDAVYAAAEGRVVYAGSGLRGYGNLIILKHNSTYLTAYAHNQALLVKEDQPVRKGQKIAEMGNSDSDKVKLHFEVRRQGKPVDPARYLPAR